MRFMRITPVVKGLLVTNVLIYLLMVLVPHPIGDFIFRYLFLYFPGSENFVVTQFITNMFVHFPDGNSIMSRHLLFNMFGLYMFGSMVEMIWGQKRFLNYYLACGLGAAVFHVLMMYAKYYHIIFNYGVHDILLAGGASGAIYGVMLAAAYLFPNNTVQMYFMIPIKLKYLVPLLITFDQVLQLVGSQPGVAHYAHLGGAVTGLALCYGINLRKWKR